ncbi:MAG: cytochrome c [Rhizobiaceae bacterium]
MASSRNIYVLVALALIGGAVWWTQFRTMPHHHMTATSAAMVDIVIPDLSEQASAGKKAFDANCAVCHGQNAAGQDGVAPPLVHKIYEPNHHGDRAFYLAAKRGVRQHHWKFGDMPPVGSVDEGEVGKIIAYVRELQRANGIH